MVYRDLLYKYSNRCRPTRKGEYRVFATLQSPDQVHSAIALQQVLGYADCEVDAVRIAQQFDTISVAKNTERTVVLYLLLFALSKNYCSVTEMSVIYRKCHFCEIAPTNESSFALRSNPGE